MTPVERALLLAVVAGGAGAAFTAWWCRRRLLREADRWRVEAARMLATERAHFGEQIREAQKLETVGALAAGIVHDFNNLLGVIRGNAQLLKTGISKGRPNADHVEAILEASDRARDLMRQILTFSRRGSTARELVDLSRIVRDLQPLLRRMVPRTVSLVAAGTDEARPILGDPTQLQQLLLNLVANAEHAMRDQVDGVLAIRLSGATAALRDGGVSVVLEVSDTGIGMSPEVQRRLFEPFFTTKAHGEGTGLGMVVVHRILQAHDAEVEVESAVGKGTRFVMRFPMASLDGLWDGSDDEIDGVTLRRDDNEVGEGKAPLPVVGAELQAPTGVRIVVVDDEPAVATVIERSLVHYGHSVHVFHVPEQALDFLVTNLDDVDLLVTDQTMPGLTGDLLAEQVHVMRPGLPVLILTGFSYRLTPDRVAAAGVARVLLKPVDMDELNAAIGAVLAGGRS